MPRDIFEPTHSTFRIDPNRVRDHNMITTRLERAMSSAMPLVLVPRAGDWVQVIDDEGNRLLANVDAVDGGRLKLRINWETFSPAPITVDLPSRIMPGTVQLGSTPDTDLVYSKPLYVERPRFDMTIQSHDPGTRTAGNLTVQSSERALQRDDRLKIDATHEDAVRALVTTTRRGMSHADMVVRQTVGVQHRH